MFQIFGLSLAGLMILITTGSLFRGRRFARGRLAWLVIWLAAAGAIFVPDVTMRLAHVLGIGRGADLVFYIAILASLVAFFLIYLRVVRLEHHLTELVRHLALAEAARRGPADD